MKKQDQILRQKVSAKFISAALNFGDWRYEFLRRLVDSLLSVE